MSTDAQTKKATWQGPFSAHMPDGSVLEVGDEYDVSEADLKSSHWQAVEAAVRAPAFVTPTSPKDAD